MNAHIYLDYAATTPVHPDVRAAMLPALEDCFGNPSSMHWAGRQAANLMDVARRQVAQGIGCEPDEVVFTAGATEADNLALLGVMGRYPPGEAHLITTRTEHHAILHTAEALQRLGYAVTYLDVDPRGRVSLDALRTSIRKETVLISVMWVNNEVGTVQDIAAIGEIAHEHQVLFHTDAVQGVGLYDLDLSALPIGLLSLSAHKIYGPKGVGALCVRQGIQLSPLTFGGPQEGGLHPGTENMPGILGLGAAVELAARHRSYARDRLGSLRQRLLEGLQAIIPRLLVNSPQEGSAAHVLSLSFPGADAEMMLIHLNARGVAVSMGSACNAKDIKPSHVLTAMGLTRQQIESTLRFSIGLPTTEEEIDRVIAILPDVYEKSRES